MPQVNNEHWSRPWYLMKCDRCMTENMDNSFWVRKIYVFMPDTGIVRVWEDVVDFLLNDIWWPLYLVPPMEPDCSNLQIRNFNDQSQTFRNLCMWNEYTQMLIGYVILMTKAKLLKCLRNLCIWNEYIQFFTILIEIDVINVLYICRI